MRTFFSKKYQGKIIQTITKVNILRAVFLCAWVDGEIQERERIVLSQILATIEIADEIHSLVHSWMTEAPTETEELWENLSKNPQTAKTALYQIVNMAAADNVFQFSELSMMDRFREKLNVSMDDYHEIISEIEMLVGKKLNS